MKNILIAIPTNADIKPETYKSIYDLEVPDGYETDFQYFYGYRIDQIRNLIADWSKNYDYLLAIDHDMIFQKDTLKKMLLADKDIVSGCYIQRNENQALELYFGDGNRIPVHDIFSKHNGLVQVGGCGFGCVLIKSYVFTGIGYPQFEYHSALSHNQTLSEDVDFCRKATNKGYEIWADTTIVCGHIGNKTFLPNIKDSIKESQKRRFVEIANQDLLPKQYQHYINTLNIEPKVIYDIGSSVCHWYKHAKRRWNDSDFYLFEAMEEVKDFYDEQNLKYHCGVLSDKDGKVVEFYKNLDNFGGNSYYKENEKFSPLSNEYFKTPEKRITMTLDTIVDVNSYPLPDLLKIDVQGAEMDILKGSPKVLSHVKDIFIELQSVEYNSGAPSKEKVQDFLEKEGFVLVTNIFLTDFDGEYHFRRAK